MGEVVQFKPKSNWHVERVIEAADATVEGRMRPEDFSRMIRRLFWWSRDNSRSLQSAPKE